MQGMISGSSNFGRLAISNEALQSMYHAKVQLLLILIETLDLENLLQMIHDEMPFRCQQLITFLSCLFFSGVISVSFVLCSFDPKLKNFSMECFLYHVRL